jgi:LacI family transcriptional regulator
LSYQPNETARALRGRRSHSIGLILPYLYDPFFAVCAHAVSAVAKQHGYSVIITTSDDDPEIEYNEASQMLQRYVEGLIVIPASAGPSRLNRNVLGRIPLVAFDQPINDPTFDTVLVQNQSGAKRMVQHLIEHGHRRICFMGRMRGPYTINARFQGYRRAMFEAGLALEASFECNSPESTLNEIQNHLHAKEPPTAYFTSNTLVTRYVFTALLQLGVRIPADIALAGFDDFEMADLTSPPLSVVRQPVQQMGSVAANQLFERLAHDETPQTGNHTVLPVELVLRRSCGCKNKNPVLVH